MSTRPTGSNQNLLEKIVRKLPIALPLALAFTLTANGVLFAQQSASPAAPYSSSSERDPSAAPGISSTYPSLAEGIAAGAIVRSVPPAAYVVQRPFSKIAIGSEFSPLGPGLQLATNFNRHVELRAVGNYFTYNASNLSTNGFKIDARLNYASARASVDIHPFRNGFRISPGVLFYNQNRVAANAPVTPGTSFTLNSHTFYAADPNPSLGRTALSGTGSLKLNSNRPAFTATAGWGRLTPRSGSHFAFPVEVGAAFIGAPRLDMNLKGSACYDKAQALCTNVSDPANPIAVLIQGDLKAQIATWTKDISPLRIYPIVSTGVTYSFNIHPR